jgi:glucan phosphoethanolaminetransferase (alkaline phosphatase superfamily)
MRPRGRTRRTANDVPPRATPGTSRWHPLRIAGGLILAGVALAMAWYGMRIDQWYGASLGKTEEASTLLAGLSVCADTLALVLPSSALALWADGRRTVAGAAWAVWGVVLVVTLLASVGFASMNIADTTAARARVADQGAGARRRQVRPANGSCRIG